MRGIPASFWRTGTTRGTIFRAHDLARYSFEVCESIIHSALGSPPKGDGRAIDGLGGGNHQSTSFEAAIIGSPGEALAGKKIASLLFGKTWEPGVRECFGEWDAVVRLAQVDVNQIDVQWPGVVCSDMLAACAHYAISTPDVPIIPTSKLQPHVQREKEAYESSGSSKYPKPVEVPVRILVANTREVFKVMVPIDLRTTQVYEPLQTWYDAYESSQSGQIDTYGNAGPTAIEVELPLDTTVQLPTGSHVDTISILGHPVSMTAVDAGEPTVFVPATFLPQFEDDLQNFMNYPRLSKSETPKSDSQLHTIIESIHEQVKSYAKLSERPPTTICVIRDMRTEGYDTLANRYICCCQADLCALEISPSGKISRGLSEQTVVALAVAQGLKGSVPYEAWIQAQERGCGGGRKPEERLDGEVVQLSVGHPSGVSEASVRMHSSETRRRAVAVLLPKGAREIMRGEVLVPDRVVGIYEDVGMDE